MQKSPVIITKFDPNIDSLDVLQKVVDEAYFAVADFFWKDILEVKVNFLYSRQEMDEQKGKKTEPWVVGFANKNEEVFIFSPSVYDKVSNHPRSDFEFTLRHEISHIFEKRIFGYFAPIWLYEGLAGVAAEQYKNKKVSLAEIRDFVDLSDETIWNSNNYRSQAIIFTKYLFDQFGKEKVLDFISLIISKVGDSCSFESFVNLFNNYFENNFEQVFNKWKISLQ